MTKTHTATDLAWLAGILEGEGCFQNPKGGSARIALGMTDRDIIDRAATTFGSTVYVRKRVGVKTQFVIVCQGARAVGLMMSIYSFMGIRRRAKIKDVIENWRTFKRRTPAYNPIRPAVCTHGHAFTTENTYSYTGQNGREWRACLACKRRCDRVRKDRAIAARHARGLKKSGPKPEAA